MRGSVIGVCVVLGLSATLGAEGAFDHSAFNRILRACVIGERVDYAAVRDGHMDGLKGYLGSIKDLDPDTLARDDRLALYINLYNATTIREVVSRWGKDEKWRPDRGNFTVFSEPTVRVNGRWMSLNRLENEVIRPEFGEPRIHVALVCAAVSCPPLAPRAYTGADLDTMLEERMAVFINDGGRNLINVTKQTMELSQIFNWYAVDFGGPAGVVAYINGYHPVDVSGFDVEFMEYSWELNIVN